LKLELPHKIKLSEARLYGRNAANTERIDAGYIYGSNDDTNWTQIGEISASGISSGNLSTYTDTVPLVISSTDTTNSYKYFIVQPTSLTHANGYAGIGQMEYYGTGVDSIPIQIGGGNIDKVANFRVYDKFIDQNQALEIWNAQKEEFGRAKPQMVLQQGKLGIGTDAPQGSLSVADEPHNLEEFPPRGIPSVGPITADNSKVYIDGHGTYEVLYSVEQPSHFNNATDNPLVLFDKTFNNLYSGINTFALNSAGATGSAVGSGNPIADPAIYTGNGSGRRSLGGYEGIWYGLKFPFKVNLSQAHIQSPTNPEVTPNTAVFLGSEDGGLTWSKIGEFSGASWVAYSYNKYTLSHTKPINAAAIVITHSNHYYAANMAELKFFGTREQGQSVLHDGELTLTKSLTVPRIGPALDADDTPRRDRLVVEYNTSTNPTFEGAVRDTSGRGNDGVFYGGASYSATEKALKFDESGDYLEGPVHNSSGEWLHSVSMWFKRNASDSYDVLFHLGEQSAGKTSSMRLFSDNRFRFNFYDADIEASYTVNNGTWYHLAFSYSGGTDIANRKIYLNGTKLAVTNNSGTPVVLNLDANEMFTLATQRYPIEGQMNCDISNFKLYNTALTAHEVKTLYDMGRTGHIVNPQPLHIAAPLYAPGTIVQVEQSIKRDDSSTTSTSASDIPGLTVTIHPKFATSKILVSYQVNMGGNYHMFLTTKRTQNGTTTYVGNGNASGNRPLASSYQSHLHVAHVNSMNMEILDPANGTDPITYQLQFWVAHTTYTAWINRGTDNYNNGYGPAAQSSSLTVKEVCQ
jgi:hypothetical protein